MGFSVLRDGQFYKDVAEVLIRPHKVFENNKKRADLWAGLKITIIVLFIYNFCSFIFFLSIDGKEFNIYAVLALAYYLIQSYGYQIVNIGILYLFGKIFIGEGRLDELIWCNSILATAITPISIISTRIVNLNPGLSWIIIPLFLYSLILNYVLIRIVYDRSRIKSGIILIIIFIIQAIFLIILQSVMALLIGIISFSNYITNNPA